jgi:hypothetical protein
VAGPMLRFGKVADVAKQPTNGLAEAMDNVQGCRPVA